MRLIPERLRRHHGTREVAGILLVLLAFLSAGALLSYDPQDPSYGFHWPRRCSSCSVRARSSFPSARSRSAAAACGAEPTAPLGLPR
jgi:hypothetical protein